MFSQDPAIEQWLQAADRGDMTVVLDMLNSGIDVNSLSQIDLTALSMAVDKGNLEMMRVLLDFGANIEATDDLGQFPLLSAADYGQLEAVILLLDRGAELDAVCCSDMSALANAAIADHHAIVDRLLLDRGAANLADRRADRSMIAEANRHGHVQVVQLLLDRGASLQAVGRDGLTPLDWAIQEGRDEVVALLKSAEARTPRSPEHS